MSEPKKRHFTGIRSVGDDMVVAGNVVSGAHTGMELEGNRAAIIGNTVTEPASPHGQSPLPPAHRRWYQDLSLQLFTTVVGGLIVLVVGLWYLEPWAKRDRPVAAGSAAAPSQAASK